MKKQKKFKEPEIIETKFKVVYNKGCASITHDLNSFYADYILSDALLEYKEYVWHIMKFPKERKHIRVKRFRNYKSEI